jgi:hypothetical protein
VIVPKTASVLRASLEALLGLHTTADGCYGNGGACALRSALYRSHLHVSSAAIVNGVARVELAGDVAFSGDGDGNRAIEQIAQTAGQFPSVTSVDITVNGRPLRCLADASGACGRGDASGTKEYKDDRYGFSFEYPAAWPAPTLGQGRVLAIDDAGEPSASSDWSLRMSPCSGCAEGEDTSNFTIDGLPAATANILIGRMEKDPSARKTEESTPPPGDYGVRLVEFEDGGMCAGRVAFWARPARIRLLVMSVLRRGTVYSSSSESSSPGCCP